MTVLPRKVGGQHTIEYTTANGEVKTLVRINARDEKWYLIENKNVQISTAEKKNDSRYGEVELKEYNLYYLRRNNEENIILMVEPDREDRRYYAHFEVPGNGIFYVGQDSSNEIQFRNPYVNAGKHLKIQYYADGTILVSDCQNIAPGAPKNYGYLNSKRIEEGCSARYGDVIFLAGLKIILGPDFIAMNNPDMIMTTRLKSRSVFLFEPKEEDESELIPEEDYFSSEPRERLEIVPKEYKIENPPDDLKEPDTPWIVMLGPSITMSLGSVFSTVMTMNNMLSTGGKISQAMPSLVTSVVMVMGSVLWPILGKRVQKRSQARKLEIAVGDYEEYLDGLRNQIDAEMNRQREILLANNPGLPKCLQMIKEVSPDLWARSRKHKDFLEIMIGQGNLELEAKFEYPEQSYHSEVGKSAAEMYALVAGKHYLENVPVTLPLKNAGIVGVIGPRQQTINFVQAMLVELTALHNYEDLKIMFIYDKKEAAVWDFVKWIPHLWNQEKTMRFLATDADEIRTLSDYITNIMEIGGDTHSGDYQGPHYLIFAADKALAERAQAIKELYHGKKDTPNITMVALYNERARLPKACSYVVDLDPNQEHRRMPERYQNAAATLADYNDITGQRIVCNQVISYEGRLQDVFVKMSNIHLDTNDLSNQLPTHYTFMEMMNIGKPEHLDLLRRWKEHNVADSMATPIGIDVDGYFINLDLHEKAHGPHGVIAGMTGSGKSEFIIAFLASLVVNYSPEDVALVLIDFKGGGMADVFKTLPHTAGVITNLDGNELRRSFLAIEKELEKRQKLFKDISDQKKISNIDINKYHKLRLQDKSLKPLPHLILVSDEFAELKQQHRDFMNQLIRIARIGRSLGVHLILATQKPDGVVDDQIKSNIRFKVCLKVQDKADSMSMIERPDATMITNSGRFYFKVGNDEVFEYGQSPWSGASYQPRESAYKNNYDYIEILSPQGFTLHRETVPAGKREEGLPEKQIDAIVQYISEVASDNNISAEKLWLNPLPGPKDEKKKEAVHVTEIRRFVMNPVIGQYDDLQNQLHLPLTVPFSTEGNALLYGTSGSGKLEFINAMLVSIMKEHDPEEVNFYLADYDSGSLEAFADSCYTKHFAGAGDRAAIDRIFEELVYQLAERREKMRRYGGNYQNYVENSGQTLPNLILVIHNYLNMADTYSEAREKISQLAREGVKYGIYVVISGTASNSIPYSLMPLFKNIYTLRQNSDDQYRDLVGKTEGIVPSHFRGRGLVRVDDVVCEFQTDMIFEDADNVYEAIRNFCEEKNAQYKPAEKKEEIPAFIPAFMRNQQGQPAEEPAQNMMSETGMSTADNTSSKIVQKRDDIHYPSIILGRDRETRMLKELDLTATASTILLYDDIHIRPKDNLMENILSSSDTTYVIEPGNEENENIITALWDTMKERQTIGLAAKKQGLEIPKFDLIGVVVRHPVDLADELSSETRVHLMTMIAKLSVNYRIFFLVEESANELFALMQGKCLSIALPFKQALLLSSDAAVREVVSEDITFTGTVRKQHGYLVSGGTATIIEFPEL